MKTQDRCTRTPQVRLATGQTIALAAGALKASGVGAWAWGLDELILLGNQEVTEQGAHYTNTYQGLLEKLEITHGGGPCVGILSILLGSRQKASHTHSAPKEEPLGCGGGRGGCRKRGG